MTTDDQAAFFRIVLDARSGGSRIAPVEAFDIDDIRVSTHYLNHPALTLGYRLEADGATVVYCCDHEPHSQKLASGFGDLTGQDLQHAEFVAGADLLIHDAQYTAEEYKTKIGWGHSSVEYVVALGQHAGVKRVALTHHDPLRDDDALDHVIEVVKAKLKDQGSPLNVFAAVEGQIVEVEPSLAECTEHPAEEFQAETAMGPALTERSILLSISDPHMATILSEAIRAEGIQTKFFSNIDEVRSLILTDQPSLAILEHDLPRIDGIKTCRAIRQCDGADVHQLPVVIMAAREDAATGAAAGVTDWLIKPFSSSYVRTKIRTWVLRTACHWMRAGIPQDEEQRIASLRDLRILDTEPEERFDRITRLAAALFDVPVVLVSLVDENRQWFKSRHGLSEKETSRDIAFCAHVVYSREPMIVSDTFQDTRFADNPLVIDGPRIRFYAGYPLVLDDGSCVGSLCLIDTRPRSLEGADLARWGDLANLAVRELIRMNAVELSRP
jgi:DNA-binding response OmpR family regulator